MRDAKNNISEEHRTSKKDFKGKYFIKDIENLTGIKAYTLRIWEQRYNLLEPKRTDTNIRYYEEDDLRYLINISILNSNGYKISRIAGMTKEEVQAKTLEVSESHNKYENQIQALSKAMLAFDEREFNKILSISILKIGMEETVESVIFPFMHHVGILWLSGSIHVAHEHFITNLVRQRLFVAIDQLGASLSGRRQKFLLFVPNGENHDLGLLFASYLLRAQGFHVIYLGMSTPFEDLSQIFALHKPDYVFCAVTNSQQVVPVEVLVKTLGRLFHGAHVLLTGNEVLRKKDLSVPSNCSIIGSITHFREWLDALES